MICQFYCVMFAFSSNFQDILLCTTYNSMANYMCFPAGFYLKKHSVSTVSMLIYLYAYCVLMGCDTMQSERWMRKFLQDCGT
jgi:hypothetical protein